VKRRPEVTANIAAANRLKNSDPIIRAKRSATLRGRKHSPEHRDKVVAILRLNPPDPEHIKRLGLSMRGKPKSAIARSRMSLAHKTSPKAAAHRLRMWEGLTREQRLARTLPGIVAASANPSGIELIVRKVLDGLGIEYETQKRIGSYFADIYVPSRNLVIECDGEYWHRNTREQDATRDLYMTDRGYTVLRLAEKDIRSGDAWGPLAEAVQVAQKG
jgi:very-short-patch-repair endonuclease